MERKGKTKSKRWISVCFSRRKERAEWHDHQRRLLPNLATENGFVPWRTGEDKKARRGTRDAGSLLSFCYFNNFQPKNAISFGIHSRTLSC
jgi:hypothetical protein